MKSLILKASLVLALGGTFSLFPAQAALKVTASENTPTASDNSLILAGDATDLIYTNAPTLAAAHNPSTDSAGDGIVNTSAINDGTADPGSGLSGDEYTPNGSATWSYDLNLTLAPSGYNLTEVDLYTGYNGGFYSQDYQIYVKTTKDSNWVSISGGNDITDYNYDSNDVNYGDQVNLTKDTEMGGGYIATDVTAIEFVSSGVVQKELQVFGSPALAPEPSTWALLLAGLGLLGFSLRRRRA